MEEKCSHAQQQLVYLESALKKAEEEVLRVSKEMQAER